MKIRTKLLLFISSVMGLYTMGLISMMAILTVTSFQQAENAIARADLQRAVNALRREAENLGATATDYAKWDDTWNFARGDYPDYPEVNFSPETCENLNLGFVAVLDADGKWLYSGHKNAEGVFASDGTPTSPVDAPPAYAWIAKDHSGFLADGDRVVMCEAAHITRNDGSGPEAGTLILGKYLDADFFSKLSEQTGVPIAFFTADSGLLPSPQSLSADGAADGAAEGEILRRDESSSILNAAKSFVDARGAPLFLLQTSTERTITQKGLEITLFIVVVAACFTLVIGLIGRLVFKQWLNRPLERLEGILKDVDLDSVGGHGENPFLPLDARNDEIGHVMSALSSMHERLGSAYDQIRVANNTLEAQVAARTSSLSAANHNLALYGRILQSTSEGIVITDLDGTISDANDAFCAMSGFSKEELIGKNPRIMKSDRHDSGFYTALWSTLLSEGHWSGEVWNRRRTGEVYPKWLSINAIYDDDNLPEKFVGVSTDISKIKKTEEHLHQLAFYDPLTGLPNRALFGNRLEHAIALAHRANERVGLLFLDLDRFKNINDTLGHAAGDELLVKVAKRIRTLVREADTVCRIGGDEFTVILDKIGHEEDAEIVAGKIISALSLKFDLAGTEIYVGASIGISIFPKDGGDNETLVKKADTAMYYAKESGRGKWFLATSEIDQKTRRRMETESLLRGALERGEFQLHYQPQTAAILTKPGSGSGLLGAEALLRWKPRGGGTTGPDSFMDIAEDIGLIVPIGAWVLGEACREAKAWADAGMPLQVSVNVSARQFEDGSLPGLVARNLAETGLRPELLKLEITESLLMRDMENVIVAMNAIRKTGVMFSIDDFGTGYSSLKYLDSMPLDSLKIDKAFITRLTGDQACDEIVTAVIFMAKAFGLSSVAEGVETVEQLAALQKLGCDEIQGYLVSKPLPAEEFRRFMLAERVVAAR